MTTTNADQKGQTRLLLYQGFLVLGSNQFKPHSNSMPAIANKIPVLNGRGSVFSYVTDPNKFYYRELIPGTKKYRTKLIPGATTIEEAAMSVIDIAFALKEQPITNAQQRTSSKSQTIEHAVSKYLQSIEQQFQAGLLAENLSLIHI